MEMFGLFDMMYFAIRPLNINAYSEINSFRSSNAYMRRLTNHNWLR